MNSRLSEGRTREVTIRKYEFLMLESKAEELGVDMADIVEWLIEECMDEYEKYMA